MNNNNPDEQLDRLIRTLIADASMPDDVVNEIADSPVMWWGVQRQINGQRQLESSPWPPIGKLWRYLATGLPFAVAAVLAVAFMLRGPSMVIDNRSNVTVPAEAQPPSTSRTAESLSGDRMFTDDSGQGRPREISPRVTNAAKYRPINRPLVRSNATVAAKKTDEIKTEFIALSYARNPDSGQIVRLKVPSSMMVTLGLVASVDKPTSMIDAEVLIGDDGLTRAIRFIR